MELKDGSLAEEGDIVVCSDQASDFENPCDLGRVIKVVKAGQKLVGKKGAPHPDGAVGHIFVLSYKKQKCPRKPLEECEGWWSPNEVYVLPVTKQKLTENSEVAQATYQGNSKNCDRDTLWNNWQMLVKTTEPTEDVQDDGKKKKKASQKEKQSNNCSSEQRKQRYDACPSLMVAICHAGLSCMYVIHICHACMSCNYVMRVCHAFMSYMGVMHVCVAQVLPRLLSPRLSPRLRVLSPRVRRLRACCHAFMSCKFSMTMAMCHACACQVLPRLPTRRVRCIMAMCHLCMSCMHVMHACHGDVS